MIARHRGLALAGTDEAGHVTANLIEERDQGGIRLRVTRRAQPDVDDPADLLLVEDDRDEKHRVRRRVADFLACGGGHAVGGLRADDERLPIFLRFEQDSVDVLALPFVVRVGARREVILRDDLPVAALAGQPYRAALRLERRDDTLEEIVKKLRAVAAGAREFGDLGDVLPNLRAGFFEELFLFERRHDE